MVVGIWKLENPAQSFAVNWLDQTIDFVQNRLEMSLHAKGFNSAMHVDYSKSFFSCHSAGCHVPVVQLAVIL